MAYHFASACVGLALLPSPALAQQDVEIGKRYNLNFTFAPPTSTAETCLDLENAAESITLSTIWQPYTWHSGNWPKNTLVEYCRNIEDILEPSLNSSNSTNSTAEPEWRNTYSVVRGNTSFQIESDASNPLTIGWRISESDSDAKGSTGNSSMLTAWRSVTFWDGRDCTGLPATLSSPPCGTDRACNATWQAWSLRFEIPGPDSEDDPRLQEEGACLVQAPSSNRDSDENGAIRAKGRRATVWWTGSVMMVLFSLEMLGLESL